MYDTLQSNTHSPSIRLYTANLKVQHFSTKGLKYPRLFHMGCEIFSFLLPFFPQISLVSFTFNAHRHENRFRIINEIVTLKLF